MRFLLLPFCCAGAQKGGIQAVAGRVLPWIW
jgi:hypothetical protein